MMRLGGLEAPASLTILQPLSLTHGLAPSSRFRDLGCGLGSDPAAYKSRLRVRGSSCGLGSDLTASQSRWDEAAMRLRGRE